MSTPAPHTPGMGEIQRRLIRSLQQQLGLSDHDLDASCRVATGVPLTEVTRARASVLIAELRQARERQNAEVAS